MESRKSSVFLSFLLSFFLSFFLFSFLSNPLHKNGNIHHPCMISFPRKRQINQKLLDQSMKGRYHVKDVATRDKTTLWWWNWANLWVCGGKLVKVENENHRSGTDAGRSSANSLRISFPISRAIPTSQVLSPSNLQLQIIKINNRRRREKNMRKRQVHSFFFSWWNEREKEKYEGPRTT